MTLYESQVRKFYAEIWDKKNYQEIPNILHQDFHFRGSLGDQKLGHEGFKDYVDSVHSALGNYRCMVKDLVVQPEAAFARMKFSGIHQGMLLGFPATHQPVSWDGAALFKFKGDKVSSLWVLGDLKQLEQQLSS